MKISWLCPNCEKTTQVEVFPYIPAKIYGDPLDCYPAEGGYFEPENCENCNCKIPEDEPFEEAADLKSYYRELKAESEEEARREY